jgi:hypothetical protein
MDLTPTLNSVSGSGQSRMILLLVVVLLLLLVLNGSAVKGANVEEGLR